MVDSNGTMRWRFSAWVSTVGPAGHTPVAPGTVGALVAIPFGLWLHPMSAVSWAVLLLTLTVLSTREVTIYLGEDTHRDPNEVVVDEFVGCLIALAFVPYGLLASGIAFLLFRVFDILKPWPVCYFDQNVKGAWGVMLDDVAAGILAGLTAMAICSFFGLG